ncbi:hypothetical protein GCM10009678_48960 [Actinomadura kijaniata]|uniref:CU044_5270 family protein n=1 Tax=Actinomadura namibiensis TaxID=182080 RepID=A0A7W3LWE2_ACTNM|nr:CU044_5270 family protein [Actinomadura namibiensis]MBA8955455.1 hypothetical protein [Actinomadura namibiensis]
MRRSETAARDVRRTLAAHNPVPAPATEGLDERARGDLAAILAVPRDAPARRRMPARRWVPAAGVAAALAVGGTVAVDTLRPPAPVYAATPPELAYQPEPAAPPARALLLRLAARARTAPPLPGGGPYGYVRTQGWYLGSRVGDDTVTSAVLPQQSERWIAADGTGRVRTTTLPPVFPDAASREAWEDDVPRGPHVADGRADSAMWRPGSLSTDPVRLARQLEKGHPPGIGPVERLVAVTDLAREQPIPPALQSAVLKVLAGTPTLVYRGGVTDRAGRKGIAFSIDSAYSGLPTRHTVIFAADTGRLLGYEEVLTGTAGKLNVRPRSVTSYTVFLHSGRAPNDRATP